VAKVTITISNVSWRGGRPRYQPGPKHRKLGLKGQDLKRLDGSWMSAEEAAAWVEAQLRPRIAEVKAAKAAGKRAPRRKAPGAYTLEDLFEDLWKSPKFTAGEPVPGRPKRKALAPATIRDYRAKAAALAAFDPELYGSDVAALSKPILVGLHERLWHDKGHHMANAILKTLSVALSYGVRKELGGLKHHPALRLGIEQPDARVRVGTIGEMTAMIRAADAIGLTMVGHAIMLGLMTGQRQTERLALMDAGHEKGWRRFRQSKTAAIVEVPETPQLTARLSAAATERRVLGVKVANVVVDPKTGAPFTQSTYNKVYRQVRTAAVAGVKDAAGAWIVEPCPTLADFQDRDLRDTAVTWLARAGCTVPEIRSITGHDPRTIYSILKHYLAIDREQASAAIGKLVLYLESEGAAL